MSVTHGIGQTPCSFEHYLVVDICCGNVVSCAVTTFRCLLCSITRRSFYSFVVCTILRIRRIAVDYRPHSAVWSTRIITTVQWLYTSSWCLSVLLTAAEVDTTVKLMTKLSPFTRFRATRRFVEDGLEPIRGKTLFPHCIATFSAVWFLGNSYRYE